LNTSVSTVAFAETPRLVPGVELRADQRGGDLFQL